MQKVASTFNWFDCNYTLLWIRLSLEDDKGSLRQIFQKAGRAYILV